MFEVADIWKSFGAKAVLKGVTFEAAEGTLTGLIGPGGSGKSVLLKIIAGVLKADHGHASRGSGIGALDLGLMFQEGALFDSLSVFDNVAFPLVGGRVPASILPRKQVIEVRDSVEAILSHVGLVHAAEKIPAQLSGGMRRRVSLARALVAKPRLLLLDDPTFGLDPVASSVIMKLITDLHASYRPTCILVSQDLRRLLPVVDRFMFLNDGKIAFTGNLDEFKQTASDDLKYFVSCRFGLTQSDSPGGGSDRSVQVRS